MPVSCCVTGRNFRGMPQDLKSFNVINEGLLCLPILLQGIVLCHNRLGCTCFKLLPLLKLCPTDLMAPLSVCRPCIWASNSKIFLSLHTNEVPYKVKDAVCVVISTIAKRKWTRIHEFVLWYHSMSQCRSVVDHCGDHRGGYGRHHNQQQMS